MSHPLPKLPENMRPFRRSDWMGARIRCPHCGKVLRVIDVEGPFVGEDPSEHCRVDRYWVLTLEDGNQARMWEDRKGVVIPRVPPEPNCQKTGHCGIAPAPYVSSRLSSRAYDDG